MNEFKRIFGKKNILLLLFLLLFNYILIISNDEDVELACIYDDMIDIADKNYSDTLSSTEIATKAWQEYFEINNVDVSEDSDKTILAKLARDKLMKEAKYIDGFKNMVEEKKKTAILYATSGTYKKDSFEYNNLLKTQYDLSQISDLNLKLSNGIWIEKLYENNYIHIFAMISCIFTVSLFFNERKNGLYFIVHTASNGRAGLFFKRCVILVLQSFLVNAVLYIETIFLLLNMYGGKNGLNVAAASNEYFVLTSETFTRIEFAGIIIMLSTLTTTALSLLLWVVLLCFSNVNIGIFFYFFVCVVDILIYNFISAKSIFKAVKFLNVYYLIFPNESLDYYNWGYSWGIFSLLITTVSISTIIAVVALVISAYISINKYFNGQENIIERVIMVISSYIMRLIEKTNNFGKEIYKILISQRIIFVVLVLMYISINIQPSVGVIYDAKKSYMLGYYEKAEGLSYGPELLSIYNKYKVEHEQFIDNFDYTMENAGIILANHKDLFNTIETNVNYIKQMNDSGVEAVVINQYEYTDSISSKEYGNQELVALINVIASVVIACGFISYEKKMMIHDLILTCKERRRWLMKKIIVQSILILIFATITYGIYYMKLGKVYNYENLMAPLKSIMLFQNFIINPPILVFIIIDFIVKLLFFISIQLIVDVVSIYVKYVYSFAAGAIIVMPQLLYMIGFDYVHKLSIVKYISFFSCWIEGGNIMNTYWLIVCLIMILGMCSWLYIMKNETR